MSFSHINKMTDARLLKIKIIFNFLKKDDLRLTVDFSDCGFGLGCRLFMEFLLGLKKVWQIFEILKLASTGALIKNPRSVRGFISTPMH